MFKRFSKRSTMNMQSVVRKTAYRGHSFYSNIQLIKMQDKQHEQFLQAQAFAHNGNVEFAIEILKNIMYDQKLVMEGARWPFVLSDLYYKNEMYDECWAYLEFLNQEYHNFAVSSRDKIDYMKYRILNKQKKYIEALYYKSYSFLKKYNGYSQCIDDADIEKEFKGIIKRAKLIDRYDEVTDLIKSYALSKISLNDVKFKKQFDKIIKSK